MHVGSFHDLAIILVAALAVTLLFHRFKIPEIIGFLLTGTIIGPHGLGWVRSGQEINLIAEVGVIFLLFTIGLEFSLKEFVRIKRLVIVCGGLQVGLTTFIAVIISKIFGFSISEGIFYGFLLSMSSTVIVLSALESRNLTSSPVGGLALAILLFQDIAVVPMALLIPILKTGGENLASNLGDLILSFIMLGVVVYILHRFVLSRVMTYVAKTKSQEIFTIGVFAVCMGCAYLTGIAGLSMPLGAFIAGLILSESDYGYQASNTVHSFRNLFSAFFFVSIGMMFEPNTALVNPATITALTCAMFLIKWITSTAAVRLMGFPIRLAVTLSLLLGQVGEFSFVLAQLGVANGIFSSSAYQLFLAASIITMIASPGFIAAAPALAYRLTRRFAAEQGLEKCDFIKTESATDLTDHIIVVGFGVNGRNIAYAAKSHKIPYIIIEMNPETVAREKSNGEPIIFGDASFPHVLEKAGISTARIICVLISDGFSTRKIVDSIRRLNPALHTIVRTREISEVDKLVSLGANEVVPEEFETSLEIFSRVLRNYLVAESTIEEMTEEMRQLQYRRLTEQASTPTPNLEEVTTPQLSIETLQVGEAFTGIGRTLQELDIRNKFGVTVVALQRDGNIIENPSPREKIDTGDFLFVVGKRRSVLRFGRELNPV